MLNDVMIQVVHGPARADDELQPAIRVVGAHPPPPLPLYSPPPAPPTPIVSIDDSGNDSVRGSSISDSFHFRASLRGLSQHRCGHSARKRTFDSNCISIQRS